MSWSCSASLFLPPANLAAALRAAARVVVPSPGPPCAVALPGGEVLHLPFASRTGAGSGPVVIGREPVWFGVTLQVPADEVVDEWWDEEPYTEAGCRYIGLGPIGLAAGIGERYAELSFHATSGAASSVLFESRAAHNRLQWVLHEAGGLAGAVMTDTVVEVRSLADWGRLLVIDWDWVRADGEAHFLDRLAESVVSQTCGRP